MADNKINVGGRLHSIATGNVLAGANEILDDSKNKKQSEINTETYSLVNDVNERLSGLSPDQQSALSVAAKATNNETKLGYYVCDTEGNVAEKVISNATGYVLSPGGSMKVKMTNANTVDNATLNINSTGAKALYYDGERASAKNSWEAGETVEVYYDGTSFYANSVAGGSGSGDGAFDVSVKYPTSGVEGGNTYTLDGALAVLNANLPASKKKGGMSIKFVQSSDNKYVQYRLIDDEFTTNTTQWAIAEEGVYIDNPEFIVAFVDNKKKFLWGIQVDGNVMYGAGVPKQVREYISQKIKDLSLDEYEDIVTFLGELINGDKTLQQLLNEKVDKETGKALIPSRYVQEIDNPEFVSVWTDNDSKLLLGIRTNGDVLFGYGVPTQIVNYVNTLLQSKVDKEEGKELISAFLLQCFSFIDSPEWISIDTDINYKVLGGYKNNGERVEKVGVKTPYVKTNVVEADNISAKEIISGSFNVGESDVDILNVSSSLNFSTPARRDFEDNIVPNPIKTKTKEQEFSLLVGNAGNKIECFLFFSDPHYFMSYDSCILHSYVIEYIKNIKDYFNNTPTDFVLCGGDWLIQQKQSIAIKDLGWIDGVMNSLFPDCYYPVFGNHDDNYQGEKDTTDDRTANDGELTTQQMINLWFRKYHKKYYSFKGTSTKFYVLDSGIDWVTAMDAYKWEQVDWFANELLNGNDSDIMLAIHIIGNNANNFDGSVVPIADNILKVAEAFNGRTTITLNDITYDFSNKTGIIHAALCGHTHADIISTINSIPVYCIKDAQNGSFDLVLLDYENHKLSSVRVGTGSNREMTIL